MEEDFTGGAIHDQPTRRQWSIDPPFDARVRQLVRDWDAKESPELIEEMIVTALTIARDRMSVAAAARGPRDAESDVLREKLTALQVDLERSLHRPGADDSSGPLDLRREIDTNWIHRKVSDVSNAKPRESD